MNVSYVKGDIVEAIKKFRQPEKLHVAHGANCFHIMGAGVAKVLNELTNGSLLEADKKSPYGDINKMGKYSKLIESNYVRYYNCYTQHGTKSGGGVYVHWDSVFGALLDIVSNEMIDSETLFIPKIGAGLAGGDEKDFLEVLQGVCHTSLRNGRHIDIVVFSL